MLKRTRITLTSLIVIIASLIVYAKNTTRSSHFRITQTSSAPHKTQKLSQTASACLNALERHAVCASANKHAVELMTADRLKAIVVVQDVRTGALVTFAASHPSELDVTTPLRPLSLSKVLLSASWWDNRQPDSSFDSTKGDVNAQNPAYRSRVTVHEMLVGGSDSAGRQAALALRKSVGTKKVLEDFVRYGFGQRTGSSRDDKFWVELAPAWKMRLVPAPASVSLSAERTDDEWAEALSLGETNLSVTALHVSRFMQAVGNKGMMLTPSAREEQSTPAAAKPTVSRRGSNSVRVMQERTALRLESALLDTVQRGTAKSIAKALEDTGWQIGGKTGSGPALLPKGDQIDGWFAGLIFDPERIARFTVVTFVRSGGYGGGNAAKISAELARYIIDDKTTISR